MATVSALVKLFFFFFAVKIEAKLRQNVSSDLFIFFSAEMPAPFGVRLPIAGADLQCVLCTLVPWRFRVPQPS